MARSAALLKVYDMEDQLNGYSDTKKKRMGKPERAPRVSATNKLNMKLKDLVPLTEAQREMMEGFTQGSSVVASGAAGTGKSTVACYLAFKELMLGNVSQVKIIRHPVASVDLGHLPGDLQAKIDIYSLPYKDIVNDLFECGTAYEMLEKKGVLDFCSTAYLRGLTFRNCVIVFDEFQNADRKSVFTTLSRCGENCRFIICGDTRQKDVPARDSGFGYLLQLAEKMPEYFDVVNFQYSDIIRSEFCKKLIIVDETI